VDDKRQHARFTVVVPVRVHARSGRFEALCRDGSAGGALIVAEGAELAVGESVTVAIPSSSSSDAGRETFIIGKVVRLEDPSAEGTRKIGVEFLRPVPELEVLFTRSSERPPRDAT
jgi:c-di-GMP-binding flagellar brake protein YcgR